MPAQNTQHLYGTVTKIFHWLTALLILTVIPLGVVANEWAYETNEQLAFKAQLFSYHKTLGVIIFWVALARILWAVRQTKPGGLHPERKAETLLAEVVHWLLYISLVAVPLTGWIHHAASTGFAPILLPIGQELPLVPKSEAVSGIFASLHWIWSKIMVGSILLHIAGALKHQFIDKDATLGRMWFGAARRSEAHPHQGNLIAPIAALGLYAIATGGGAAAGFFHHEETVEAVALTEVASDWAVQDGTIAITVTQLGSPVSGSFEEWTSIINFDPDASGTMGNVTTTISIGSLTLGSVTGQAMGSDFFNAEAFPTATFSAEIIQSDAGYLADGTLTIKGNSVPIKMPFDLSLNDNVAVMSGALSLDRQDFQIGESMADETNLGFGVDVKIDLTAQRGAS